MVFICKNKEQLRLTLKIKYGIKNYHVQLNWIADKNIHNAVNNLHIASIASPTSTMAVQQK